MNQFFFLLMIQIYPRDCHEERQLWALLGLLARAYSATDAEFTFWNTKTGQTKLKKAAKKVVSLVKHLYGSYNCTYNIHMLLHLGEIRRHGPLCESSAFSTEGFYSKIRSCISDKPSKHLGKQILTRVYSDYTHNHRCEKQIVLKKEDTARTSDSYFYTFDKRSLRYEFYKFIRECEDNIVALKVVKTTVESDTFMPEIDYKNIGM